MAEIKKSNIKQLPIWVDKNTHSFIKAQAAMKNMSMFKFVQRVFTHEDIIVHIEKW